MFTSQYFKVAQNNQILNLRVLDRAHANNIDYQHGSFVSSVFREAPIANSMFSF